MKIIYYNNLTDKERDKLLKRPAIKTADIYEYISPVLKDIKRNGMKAVVKYARKFDNIKKKNLLISKKELEKSAALLDRQTKNAIDTAIKNITRFHKLQYPAGYRIETMPGVECSRSYIPIEKVGLYIPGGSAVLFSTLLMLAIPARIAGCNKIIVTSPVGDNIEPALAYAACKLNIDEFYNVGGAQAVGMLAFVKKVDKIFGPGNQYVTAAKSLVSIDPDGCAIDMPAGPSEVLVIADKDADASFIAADLLSQAEHGHDSQVLLITESEILAESVNAEIKLQLKQLPRREAAVRALKHSKIIVVRKIETAFEISNDYAPEHLILNLKNASKYKRLVKNAGSVFIGAYSPESAGDYASGTNHSLPTYGYAKSYSGVNVEAFMKSVTFQKLSKKGLSNLAPAIIAMAEKENLQAHANAVKIRLKK
ncbi:histidinol dehydrogenase [Melioribacter sp. Ez-97]|uniref:histidinol dehydrogenase n=1 Tax=Melioribacter sp. Ez-97 TaxID=3423434 RepID=UPI003EDA3C20